MTTGATEPTMCLTAGSTRTRQHQDDDTPARSGALFMLPSIGLRCKQSKWSPDQSQILMLPA